AQVLVRGERPHEVSALRHHPLDEVVGQARAVLDAVNAGGQVLADRVIAMGMGRYQQAGAMTDLGCGGKLTYRQILDLRLGAVWQRAPRVSGHDLDEV